MFSNRNSDTLSLELPDRRVHFNSVADFEFCLASRTEVPASKVAELVRLRPDELEREAGSIRSVEKRFVDVLARSLDGVGKMSGHLRELDAKLFSADHQWRDIMRALTVQGDEFDEYKKIALIKYVQYLGSRQDVLKSVYASKTEGGADAHESGVQGDLRQTVIFELSPEEESSDGTGTYARLPRGETVRVDLGPEETLELILSRHRFAVVPGRQSYLSDSEGADYALRPGPNLVGRLPENDAVVNVAYRDVSRKHLVIDVCGDNSFRLTDLSAHGTFVPRRFLDAHTEH